MWAICGLMAVGGAIFVERLISVRAITGQLRVLDRRIRDTANAGNLPEMMSICAKAPGGMGPVLMRGLEAAVRGQARDDILSEMSRDGRKLSLRIRRGLGMLATLGSMSPFTGLFGTVLGIMQALKSIGASGSTGLDVVATGVSEALITTAAGILVAVVLVLLHQWLRAILSHAVLEIQVLVEDAADVFSRLAANQAGIPQAIVSPGLLPVATPNGASAGAVHGAP